MDKETRLALLILVIAIAAWRFVRYMRVDLSRSRRPASLGVAGGVVPQDSERTASVIAPESSVRRSELSLQPYRWSFSGRSIMAGD